MEFKLEFLKKNFELNLSKREDFDLNSINENRNNSFYKDSVDEFGRLIVESEFVD